MQVIAYNKGRSTKTVTVSGVNGNDDAAVMAVAMQHAGETPTSLFGADIQRYAVSGNAVVSLYTD